MFLIDPILTHFHLNWTQQQPMIRPLPPHIGRTSVQTPSGPLELLRCEPKSNSTKTSSSDQNSLPPPIFFLHGGMGHATVWLEWLTYLHEHNYPSTLYAFSVRGHGASHCPDYKTLVHETSFEEILSDAAHCLSHINQLRKQPASTTQSTRPPILVGHSSGGGLAQALLHGTYTSPYPDIPLIAHASGLCLVDAIPHYGSLEMYWNWSKQDPYWLLRSTFHLMHPMSPLSTGELVRNAFFGHKYPMAAAEEFRGWFSGYESMQWPMAMFGRTGIWEWWWGGKRNEWLDVGRLVGALDGVEREGRDKVCVVVGKEDMMYRPYMWERVCDEFKAAIRKVRGGNVVSGDSQLGEPIEAVTVESADGVRLVLVDDAGHHIQNDVYCGETAEAVLRWASQV